MTRQYINNRVCLTVASTLIVLAIICLLTVDSWWSRILAGGVVWRESVFHQSQNTSEGTLTTVRRWSLAAVLTLSRQEHCPQDPEAKRVWMIARPARLNGTSRDSLVEELTQESIHLEL